MTPLQSRLSLQMNLRSPLLQYLPNQTTSNESTKKYCKKYEKLKLI